MTREMLSGESLTVASWLKELGLNVVMLNDILDKLHWDQDDHEFAVSIGACIGPDEQTPCLLVQYRRDPRIEPDTVWQR